MSFGGGSDIHTEDERLSGIRLMSSAYGQPVTILYGTQRVSPNIIWYGDFKAIAHTTSEDVGKGGGSSISHTSYTYTASFLAALTEGPIDGVVRSWDGTTLLSTESQTQVDQGLTMGFLPPAAGSSAPQSQTILHGTADQSPWAHLAANHPDAALHYRGTALLGRANYNLGNSNSVPNMTFEVRGLLASINDDAQPHLFITDSLANARYGAGFPGARLGDMTAYRAYTLAAGLLFSPILNERRPMADWLTEWAELSNSAVIWSDGRLKMVPYGDEALTGNGITYTPDVTPRYDLTDADFLEQDDGPVVVEGKGIEDAYNDVSVEFQSRALDYSTDVVQRQDLARIEAYGQRIAPKIVAKGVTRAEVAAQIAQTRLQRYGYVLNEYTFRLPWRFCLLEPMDRLTLTCLPLGMDHVPVRIIEIEEDEDGELSVRAEDAPIGIATPAGYGVASATGAAIDYYVAPGDVADPVAFEPAGIMVSSQLAVWIAVTGQSAHWGGCNVWASWDDANYQFVGTARGGARYGTVSAFVGAAAGDVASVQLVGNAGQLLSGSSAEAAALATLCLIGDEFVAYTTATLTGGQAYDLTLAERALQNSTAQTHNAGDRFVRIDGTIVKSEALDPALVGKTVRLKFTSFNVYGRAEQALSDVIEYTYTIGGGNIVPDESTAIVRSPVPTSPAEGAGVSAELVTLAAGGYSSRPTGIDYHYASQWQIASDAAFGALLWDSGETQSDLTSIQPPLELAASSTYYWRVRYRGEVLDWSEWSTVRSFSTAASISGVYTQLTTTNPPSARLGHHMCVVGGDIYCLGGTVASGTSNRELWKLNTLTLTWTQLANCPEDVAYLLSDAGNVLAHISGKLYCRAGNSVYSYDLSTGVWQQLATENIYYPKYVAIGQQIYITGVSATAPAKRVYDPQTNLVSLGNWPGGIGYGTWVSVGGKAYQFGGHVSGSPHVFYSVCWQHDPVSNTSNQMASGPSARGEHASCELGGLMYVYGGQTSNGVTTNELWQFDPLANTWTQLPTGLASARTRMAMVGCNNALYLFGGTSGASSGGAKLSELWRID
ncbi:phage tail protein [Azonexus caeni]|jgi:hypothetical protein|uniref:Kelch repeat-containing protein n=1 Tax=Azonexus caeni TaxID=266126 RepID=UPI003A8402CE